MKKSILITGASSGMGLADTIFFAQNNYQVFATYRTNKDEEKLKKNQKRISYKNGYCKCWRDSASI